jgi:hypothetical protein
MSRVSYHFSNIFAIGAVHNIVIGKGSIKHAVPVHVHGNEVNIPRA